MTEKVCGAVYAGSIRCTLPPRHRLGWHRNGYQVWVRIKTAYAYLQGSADAQWRELAEAVIRGQVAPGDVESAFYWLRRLHKRACRQEREDERVRLADVRARIKNPILEQIDAPGNEPGIDAAHWSPDA